MRCAARLRHIPASPETYTLLDTKHTPIPLKFTWARQAAFPCKFGVRKDVFLLGDLLRCVRDLSCSSVIWEASQV